MIPSEASLILEKYKGILSFSIAKLEQMLSPSFDFGECEPKVKANSTPIYPGSVSGNVYYSIPEALQAKKEGKKILFYCKNPAVLDMKEIFELRRFDGLIFGQISQENHNALDLLRSGLPIIKTDDFIIINEDKNGHNTYKINNFEFTSKDEISFSGTNGKIYAGKWSLLPSPVQADPDSEAARAYNQLMSQVDELLQSSDLEVMINAETEEQVLEARRWGANSIGIVRTENIVKDNLRNLHNYGKILLAYALLFELEDYKKEELPDLDALKERIAVRKKEALTEFSNIQAEAFYKLLKVQENRRTQIRLLDALAKELFTEHSLDELSKELAVDGISLPFNKFMFHANAKGAELIFDFPELYEYQIRAIFNAAKKVTDEGNTDLDLRILIPFVASGSQVKFVQNLADEINKKEFNRVIKYRLGVKIEVPVMLVLAKKLLADFGITDFSFGTNDLFPLIEGRLREYYQVYQAEAQDGTPLLSRAAISYVDGIISGMEQVAAEKGSKYSLGLCGELNDVKLHLLNLGPFVPRINYVSAGRPKQIPILKLSLAQMFLKLLGQPVQVAHDLPPGAKRIYEF